MAVLERFVILMYDRTSDITSVNKARKALFTQKNCPIEKIPPTHGALTQHVKRAVYQGGHIWGQMCIPCPEIPEPGDWGWKMIKQDQWEPLWTTESEASDICKELVKCGCKKGCRGNCKCIKASLRCTDLCNCGGDCDMNI